ncbi:MAG TPA: hemolysin family protein [Myxococcota bacterium]|nr:hemolysin family protein [Myxococcota bacterium]
MDAASFWISLIGVLGIAALVATNAFFVAAEFSLVAVRRTQVALWVAEGRRGAGAIQAAIDRLDDAIAATQLGITLASIGLGWIGEPALAGLIRPALAAVGIESSVVVHSIAVAIAFSAITFVHVVAGELAPKAIALDIPGKVALVCARPLLLFGRVFRPILLLLNGAGNALVRAFGVALDNQARSVHSPDELSLLVSESSAAGAIRPYSGLMLGNVFRLSQTRVCSVMVPRAQMTAVPSQIAPDDLLDLLRETGFTRLPVYREDLDHVVGILHTKDLFHVYARDRVVVMSDAIRPALRFEPDLPVTDALRRFRAGRQHLAIVQSEGGPVLGICTLEDVLEEIVGEIEDEHDLPTPAVRD